MQRFCLMLALLLLHLSVTAQFKINKNASALSPNTKNGCYQLTSSSLYKRGSVFQTTLVNLDNDFEVRTQLYFGHADGGADGIAFVLQNEGPGYIGNHGAAMGYGRFDGSSPSMPTDHPGAVPSFIIEFDTWQNNEIYGVPVGDPAGDHITFMSNSSIFHTKSTQLKEPFVLSTNIEDGQWHDAIFNWNAGSKTMTVSFTVKQNPETVQILTYTGDIVKEIFNGDPMVYWGFTAATGSVVGNKQAVCILPPAPSSNCTMGKTFTPEDWGVNPSAQNTGKYLHSNFSRAFPQGVVVGIPANQKFAKFTTAQAVTKYLPANGTVYVLQNSYQNPSANAVQNELLSQLLALTLNVGFDHYDENFNPSGILLEDMIIDSGAFTGYSVREFLSEANHVIGGTPGNLSIMDVYHTAVKINRNYEAGLNDRNYLICPQRGKNSNAAITQLNSFEKKLLSGSIEIYPNPSNGQFSIRFREKFQKPMQIRILNSQGVVVDRRNITNAEASQVMNIDLSRQSTGLYLVQISCEGVREIVKVVVAR